MYEKSFRILLKEQEKMYVKNYGKYCGKLEKISEEQVQIYEKFKEIFAVEKGKKWCFWWEMLKQLYIKMTIWSKSEAQSSAESWLFNIIMNIFCGNGILHDLSCAEWCISGGVKILWFLMEGSLSLSPAFDFIDLNRWNVTVTVFWFYGTCKIRPKEGMTLILMDLR